MMMLERAEELERRPQFKQTIATALRNALWPDPVALKLLGYNATADGFSLFDAAIVTATPASVSQLVFTQGSVSVSPDASDLEEVAGAFVPAGVILLDVGGFVDVTLGNGNGLTTWSLGTASERARWGSGHARTASSVTNSGQGSAPRLERIASALDVVVTADQGSFDGTGSLVLTYAALHLVPKTSV